MLQFSRGRLNSAGSSSASCSRVARVTTGGSQSISVIPHVRRQQHVNEVFQHRIRTVASAFDTNSVADGFGGKIVLPNGLVDLYVVLGVDDDASAAEIKRAYRNMARECHPDFMGDAGHDICILMNEAYEVLMDEQARAVYDEKLEAALQDEEDDYTGKMMSKWMPSEKPKMAKNVDPNERRAVFVDEFTCIGCKQCVWCASATFRMENEHGRSRVFAQWLDTEEKIQSSIDSCPVDCIHWVDKDQLPALEYVTQTKVKERTNVGVMMMGHATAFDVFDAAATFLKERKKREERLAQAARRAYSPAQERQRRAAAEALKKKNSNWAFGSFEDLLNGAFGGVGTYVQSENNADDFKKVGKRKRAMRWDDLLRMQEESGSRIPLDRALVPISVYADALVTPLADAPAPQLVEAS